MNARKSALGTFITMMASIALLLLLMAAPVQTLLEDILDVPFGQVGPRQVRFVVDRTIMINTGGGNFTVDMPEPLTLDQDGRGMQILHSVSYSMDVERTTRYGVGWTIWSGNSSARDQGLVARYDITTKAFTWDIDSFSSANISDIPNGPWGRYLGDEWVILPEDPEVISLAREIVGNESNVLILLREIYDWVRENIEYRTVSLGPQDTLATMASRAGDCDDQAILFCSLARAAGVPAWLQLGAMHNDVGRWEGHAWSIAYVPLRDGGWEEIVVDTASGDFMRWRPNRFADFTSDGDAEHLVDYYLTFQGPRGSKVFDGYEMVTYKMQEENGPISMWVECLTPADRFLARSRIRLPL